MYEGKFSGSLELTLARGVHPSTLVLRKFNMAVRRRGAAAVSRLQDEPCLRLKYDRCDEEGRVAIAACVYFGVEMFQQGGVPQGAPGGRPAPHRGGPWGGRQEGAVGQGQEKA